jgi:sterol desaturase/sphingolipid hydroxylase (fatty acid hydroxylase superfamily)
MIQKNVTFFSRLLHHKYLYKRIHKWHHEWVQPIAAASLYSHPLEHILTGSIGPSCGLLLTNPPAPVAWLWYDTHFTIFRHNLHNFIYLFRLVWLGFQVQNDHSGYHFPFVYSPEMHDFHHLR